MQNFLSLKKVIGSTFEVIWPLDVAVANYETFAARRLRGFSII